MKLKRKGKVVQEIPFYGAICGCRVDAIELNVKDFAALVEGLTNESEVVKQRYIEHLQHMQTKFVLEGFDQ